MVRVVITLALVLSALRLGAQDVRITLPTPAIPGQVGPAGERDYGPPRFAELSSLDAAPESYQRSHVLTIGVLDPLSGEFFTLKDAGPPVLVIPGHEVTAGDLMAFTGQRVEIRGIFRRIRKKEYVRGEDLDLIEDPTLPVLPGPDMGLPRNSITVLAITPKDSGRSGEAPGALAVMVRAIRENPAEHLNKKVRVVGQFRGSNLFSDLPAGSRRERADWVLKDGDAALWITGKEPRGKGWALDPRYQGDTARFVAVEGKPEVVNGIVYLRASKVSLAAAPAPKTADDESP